MPRPRDCRAARRHSGDSQTAAYQRKEIDGGGKVRYSEGDQLAATTTRLGATRKTQISATPAR